MRRNMDRGRSIAVVAAPAFLFWGGLATLGDSPDQRAGAADRGGEREEVPDAPPSQQELMLARGFVRYRGAWRTAQEIALLERSERVTTTQKQWGPRLERLRRRLDDPAAAAAAAEELREIADPLAVPALAAALVREPVAQVRAALLEALSHVGTPEALSVIVQAAIDHADADTRMTAVERLAAIGPRIAEPALVAALSGPDNARINRAAEAIGALGLSRATPALVEALETEHVVTLSDGKPAGQTSVTFGSGGDGLSFGGGPKRGKTKVRNEAVLAALERLTGQDFQWNAPAWRRWLGLAESAGDDDLRRAPLSPTREAEAKAPRGPGPSGR